MNRNVTLMITTILTQSKIFALLQNGHYRRVLQVIRSEFVFPLTILFIHYLGQTTIQATRFINVCFSSFSNWVNSLYILTSYLLILTRQYINTVKWDIKYFTFTLLSPNLVLYSKVNHYQQYFMSLRFYAFIKLHISYMCV